MKYYDTKKLRYKDFSKNRLIGMVDTLQKKHMKLDKALDKALSLIFTDGCQGCPCHDDCISIYEIGCSDCFNQLKEWALKDE